MDNTVPLFRPLSPLSCSGPTKSTIRLSSDLPEAFNYTPIKNGSQKN